MPNISLHLGAKIKCFKWRLYKRLPYYQTWVEKWSLFFFCFALFKKCQFVCYLQVGDRGRKGERERKKRSYSRWLWHFRGIVWKMQPDQADNTRSRIRVFAIDLTFFECIQFLSYTLWECLLQHCNVFFFIDAGGKFTNLISNTLNLIANILF